MTPEESVEFWAQIDAQAKQDQEKVNQHVAKHANGPCPEKCCENYLLKYWRQRYGKVTITKNGLVLFGDQQPY